VSAVACAYVHFNLSETNFHISQLLEWRLNTKNRRDIYTLTSQLVACLVQQGVEGIITQEVERMEIFRELTISNV
jgi:hypothetical protein